MILRIRLLAPENSIACALETIDSVGVVTGGHAYDPLFLFLHRTIQLRR